MRHHDTAEKINSRIKISEAVLPKAMIIPNSCSLLNLSQQIVKELHTQLKTNEVILQCSINYLPNLDKKIEVHLSFTESYYNTTQPGIY